MEPNTLWSIALTAALGLIGWGLRSWISELQRVQILLNRTREEIAKDYVTKADVHKDYSRILDRLDRLDLKVDSILRHDAWDKQRGPQ